MQYCFSTEIGTMTAISEDGFLTSLSMDVSNSTDTECDVLLETEKQIIEYLRGERFSFDLKIRLKGTDFQLAVWSAISKIGYGETWSYDDIAVEIGHPKAHRAVGTAVGVNPLPFIIPCHRVIRKNGEIGRYAFGVPLKSILLKMEEKNQKKAV